MKWPEIRAQYPNEWLVIEAFQTHTTPDHQRLLDNISVIERCSDGDNAIHSYRRIHQQYPVREFYFIHTSREILNIREQQWLGVRRSHAVVVNR